MSVFIERWLLCKGWRFSWLCFAFPPPCVGVRISLRVCPRAGSRPEGGLGSWGPGLTGTRKKVEESEVAQSCPTLCNPMDCSLPGSSVRGIFPGKNTGVSCHSLLQRSFPTLRSNLGLLLCRQILYYLSHQGSAISIYINICNLYST